MNYQTKHFRKIWFEDIDRKETSIDLSDTEYVGKFSYYSEKHKKWSTILEVRLGKFPFDILLSKN